jgi:membrane protease YdiL (CAAX protease family)
LIKPWQRGIDVWIRVALFTFVVFVVLFALQAILTNLLEATIFPVITSDEDTNRRNLLVVEIILRAVTGVVGVGLVGVFLYFDRLKFNVIGLSRPSKLLSIVILGSIVSLCGSIPTLFVEMTILRTGVTALANESILFFHILSLPLVIVIAFLGIALGEEIVFRGYILSVVNEKYSFWIALLVSSVLFGLLHSVISLINPQNIWEPIGWGITSAMAGAVFGYAYRVSNNNLTLPVVLHGFWNVPGFVLLVYTAWPNFTFSVYDLPGTFASENILNIAIFVGELVVSAAGALIIALLLLLLSKTPLGFGSSGAKDETLRGVKNESGRDTSN